MSRRDPLTRRQAIVAGLAGAAGAATIGALATDRSSPSQEGARPMATESGRMPVVFVPHGGGPWPFVSTPFGDPAELAALAAYLRSIANAPKTPTQAVLVISAHWEAPIPTVMSGPRPPMLYDYYGFPPESYQIEWPAPGDPALADRIRGLLGAGGFETAEDRARGFDHGTFVPLKLSYPDANVPTVQLSLKEGLDPAEHLAIGRALAPLRDEGVFIVGSGMTYHNLRAFNRGAKAVAATFDSWLKETMSLDQGERDRRLTAWAEAPAARKAHPREEHLLPLMVIAGAAGADRGTTAYSNTILELALSGYQFG